MAERTAWLVVYTSIAEEPQYVVWLGKEDAYTAAAKWIASNARQQLEELDWGGDAPEALQDALQLQEAGKNDEVYDAWREYADEFQPNEDIEVAEIPIGDPT